MRGDAKRNGPQSDAAGHLVSGRAGSDHRARRPAVRAGAVAGASAAALTIGVGTVMVLRTPSTARTTGPTADRITVSTHPPTMPLSPAQIVALLARRPDLGVLSDAARRASCLDGLGYPSAAVVLGGASVDIGGRRAVLLVLPGATAHDLAVVVVPPNCSAADTGLITDTQITRP